MTSLVGKVQYAVVDVGDSRIAGASEEEDDIEGETCNTSSILSNCDGVWRMVLLVHPIMTQRMTTNINSWDR